MSILDHKLPIYLNFQTLFLRMKIEDSHIPYSEAYTVLTSYPPIPRYNGIVLYIERFENHKTKWEYIYRGKNLEEVLREINSLFNKDRDGDIEWINQYIADFDDKTRELINAIGTPL